MQNPLASAASDRFNPRPTVRSGDAQALVGGAEVIPSFNPRPTVRSGDAIRVVFSWGNYYSFNPRPTVRSGDARHSQIMHYGTRCLFQSAPDREVGRCMLPKPIGYKVCSFNPRPTVRSGDARNPPAHIVQYTMFQSAPDREVGRCMR